MKETKVYTKVTAILIISMHNGFLWILGDTDLLVIYNRFARSWEEMKQVIKIFKPTAK